MEANTNLPPGNLHLSLVHFLLRGALQQKLYRQDFQDIDHLKRILLHLLYWVPQARTR